MSYFGEDPTQIPTTVLVNLTEWPWDIYPEYKLEYEEAKYILGILRVRLMNKDLSTENYHLEVLPNLIEDMDKAMPTMRDTGFKISYPRASLIIEALKIHKEILAAHQERGLRAKANIISD